MRNAGPDEAQAGIKIAGSIYIEKTLGTGRKLIILKKRIIEV